MKNIRTVPTMRQTRPASVGAQGDVVRTLTEGAKANLLVRISYIDSKGAFSVRDTEPYDIKKGKYWGWCVVSGGIRQFSLEGISSAELTDTPYTPRFPVNLQ